MRIAWSVFLDWLEVNHVRELQNLNETLHLVSELRENTFKKPEKQQFVTLFLKFGTDNSN